MFIIVWMFCVCSFLDGFNQTCIIMSMHIHEVYLLSVIAQIVKQMVGYQIPTLFTWTQAQGFRKFFLVYFMLLC